MICRDREVRSLNESCSHRSLAVHVAAEYIVDRQDSARVTNLIECLLIENFGATLRLAPIDAVNVASCPIDGLDEVSVTAREAKKYSMLVVQLLHGGEKRRLRL